MDWETTPFDDDNEDGEYLTNAYKTHPDFEIEQVFDHFNLWMLDFVTRERRERFGIYDRWWKAEREARKLQRWAEAEKWD